MASPGDFSKLKRATFTYLPVYVSIRQHTSAYVSILLEVEARHIHIPSEVLADFLPCLSELPALAAPSAYVSICQHTFLPCLSELPALAAPSAYVSTRQHMFLPCLSELPALAAPSAYVRIREHMPEYVSIRQQTSAYVSPMPQRASSTRCSVSIREHT